jgi:hypothetical protein
MIIITFEQARRYCERISPGIYDTSERVAEFIDWSINKFKRYPWYRDGNKLYDILYKRTGDEFAFYLILKREY